MNEISSAQIVDIARFRPTAPIPKRRNIGFFSYMMAARKNPLAAFGADAYEKEFIYAEAFGLKSMLVNDPEAIRRVLFDNVGNYVKGDQFLKIIKPAMGNSVLTAEGAEWRFQRRTTAPMFQMRAVADSAPAMVAAVNTMLARWHGLSEVDVSTEMMRLTYDIICRTMFSNDVSLPFEKMSAALGVYLETMGQVDFTTLFLPGWVLTPSRVRGARALSFLKAEIEGFVARRRAQLDANPQNVPDDLLTMMLKARDPEGGAVFGDAEVFDNVMTFIFAGHETTANAMAWTFYLLSEHPEWEHRVAAEATATLDERDATPADIPTLGTTRMVIEEAMRLYPPAPFISREAVEADTLSGQAVVPRTIISVSPWIVHRHKLLWDDPDYFDPLRFAPGAREKIHRFAYIPFSAGPRICIGMAFAMQEAIIILSGVARRVRLTLSPGQVIEPQARITLRPKRGMKMRLRWR